MDLNSLSTLFELLPIGAYRTLPSGGQVRANQALVRLNGFDTEAELLAAVSDIGQEWYVDPQRHQTFRTLIERDGSVLNFVSEVYRHKTRERIWVRENAHVIRDPQGGVLFYEGTVEDTIECAVGKRDVVVMDFRTDARPAHAPAQRSSRHERDPQLDTV